MQCICMRTTVRHLDAYPMIKADAVGTIVQEIKATAVQPNTKSLIILFKQGIKVIPWNHRTANSLCKRPTDKPAMLLAFVHALIQLLTNRLVNNGFNLLNELL